MAVAKGKSTMRTGKLSLHCTTMIDLLRMYDPRIKITVTEEKECNTNLIEIEGLGLQL